MDISRHGSFISLLILCYITCGRLTAALKSSPIKVTKPRKLLLFSIGGFRADYLKTLTKDCPNLRHFIAGGTSARYVQNSINVASIVNHYSIATGLYPESHGIVSNTMFDPKLNLVFNSKTRAQPEWWEDVHPIWQEIEKQGQGLSALCRWPGAYGAMASTLHCGPGSSTRDDIDQAIQWFKNDVKLVLLYSNDIKKAAIRWGPHSQQAIDQVKKLDSTIKYIVDKTRDLDVNILLTSDSGVTDLHWDHVIDLDQYVHPNSYALIQPQSTLLIYPKEGHTSEEIYKNLSKSAHIRAYLKENLPDRFHYTHNRRIPPIVAFVPLGTVVRSGKTVHKNTNEILNGSSVLHRDMGGSWYHPDYEVMRGVFFANGPSIRSGLTYGAIENSDIYGLMCALLGLNPRPSNASFHVVKSMLKSSEFEVDSKTKVSPTERKRPGLKIQPTKIIKTYWRKHGLLGDFELRGFLIFLACAAGLMALFCCIGCLNSMRKNAKGEFKRKTNVHPPLLSTNLSSSDEE